MKFVGANIHRELTLGVWVDYCENILSPFASDVQIYL